MFVRKAKYDVVMRMYVDEMIKHKALLKQFNALVERINKLGGEKFLNHAKLYPPTPALSRGALSTTEVRTMLSLCHPDKHGGKDSAVRMTQKLLKMRR